jgi:hypothetical protein
MPKGFDKPTRTCTLEVGRDIKAVLVTAVKYKRRSTNSRMLGLQLDLQDLRS